MAEVYTVTNCTNNAVFDNHGYPAPAWYIAGSYCITEASSTSAGAAAGTTTVDLHSNSLDIMGAWFIGLFSFFVLVAFFKRG